MLAVSLAAAMKCFQLEEATVYRPRHLEVPPKIGRGNLSAAARPLGISRQTLYRKLKPRD